MRVLLVEDQPAAARMIAKGLREQAYAVDVAADGETAAHEAAVHDYDVIVLDVMLPRRDGFAVCRELRRNGSAVPILMLTARDDVEARVTGLDAGADDYLIKLTLARSDTPDWPLAPTDFYVDELLAEAIRAMTVLANTGGVRLHATCPEELQMRGDEGLLHQMLRFQPIGYRWAHNLGAYDAPEPQVFLGYYRALAASSSVAIIRASRTVVP